MVRNGLLRGSSCRALRADRDACVSRLLRHLVPPLWPPVLSWSRPHWAVSPAGAAPDRSSTGSIAGARSPKRTEGSRSSTASSTDQKSCAGLDGRSGRPTHPHRAPRRHRRPVAPPLRGVRRLGPSRQRDRRRRAGLQGLAHHRRFSNGGGSSDCSSASRADARSSGARRRRVAIGGRGRHLSGIAEDHGVSLSRAAEGEPHDLPGA